MCVCNARSKVRCDAGNRRCSNHCVAEKQVRQKLNTDLHHSFECTHTHTHTFLYFWLCEELPNYPLKPNPNLTLSLKLPLNPQTNVWNWEDRSKCPHFIIRILILALSIVTSKRTHKNTHKLLINSCGPAFLKEIISASRPTTRWQVFRSPCLLKEKSCCTEVTRSEQQVICTGRCRECRLGAVYLQGSPPSRLGSVPESSRRCWWKYFVSLQAVSSPSGPSVIFISLAT